MSSSARQLAKRERDPICDVCGHNHVQGVKCDICGHVGKYIVPGGPNRPNRGAIPPVPPGPLHAPNLTPPTIDGLQVQDLYTVCMPIPWPAHLAVPNNLPLSAACIPAGTQCLLPMARANSSDVECSAHTPAELQNIDQLKVLLDTLPDYHGEETAVLRSCDSLQTHRRWAELDGLCSWSHCALREPLVSGHGNR